MQTTLQSDERVRFILMNNGVTIIAKKHQTLGSTFDIEDFQIVNGCQTSHVLFYERKMLDDTVRVPVRLIVTQDESVTESIIRATNRQTELKPEQLYAITRFSRELETFFAAYPVDQRLYYERRDCQYDRQPIQKTRIVTPSGLIRAFAGMFLEEPHRTTRTYKALRAKVGTDIFAEGHLKEPYYVAAYAAFVLESLFPKKLGSKFKPARYHILLAARLLMDKTRLPRMNSGDMRRRCDKMLESLRDTKEAERIFTEAAGIVEKAAGANFDRDSVRTEPVTNAILDHFGARRGSPA